jgi:hypothetical protein
LRRCEPGRYPWAAGGLAWVRVAPCRATLPPQADAARNCHRREAGGCGIIPA